MQPVFVKIKKSESQNQIRPEGALNLSQNSFKEKKAVKKWRLFFWLALALVLAEASFIFFLTSGQPALKYQSLIPSNALATVYFSQSALSGDSKPEALANANQKIQNFLQKSGLTASNLQDNFDEQMALVFLKNNDQLQWLILASPKTSSLNFSAFLQQAEKKLKQGFNLLPETYRQTTVTQIRQLNQNSDGLYYFRLKNFFALSDSLNQSQKMIDQILK